jgi:2-haloacid dehalogenase
MNNYFELKAWPDVSSALGQLKRRALRLGFLSNFTPHMLEGCIESAGLKGDFDFVLSTDLAKTYKPDPAAYSLATKKLALKREEILFVAFAGWDAAGAKRFGFPTFWVNRLNLPPEELGAKADASAPGMAGLVEYVDKV